MTKTNGLCWTAVNDLAEPARPLVDDPTIHRLPIGSCSVLDNDRRSSPRKDKGRRVGVARLAVFIKVGPGLDWNMSPDMRGCLGRGQMAPLMPSPDYVAFAQASWVDAAEGFLLTNCASVTSGGDATTSAPVIR